MPDLLEAPTMTTQDPSKPAPPALKGQQIIATVNPKGGVGKSTISTLLALELDARGYRVKFVDCDKQGSSSTWLSNAESSIQFYRMERDEEVDERLLGLKEEGVIVIADGPAGENIINRTLLCMADIAIMPCGPSALELLPLQATVKLLNSAKKYHVVEKGLPRGMIVPNKVEPWKNLSKELVLGVQRLGCEILPALHQRQIYADAAGQCSSVKELDKRSPAVTEMAALTDAILAILS